jgi:cell pole-organizing protein PopZ
MSDSNPPPKPAAPGAGDPQMDDILASIRRILNEDDPGAAGTPSLPPPPAGMAPPPPVATPAAEPLELTEAMMVQPPPAPDPPPPTETTPPAAPRPATPSSDLSAETLVAPAVAAATTAAIGDLLRAVAQERSALIAKGGPTIEDVVREAVRPLLKEWLDQHLGALVERLVRAEIERVVGRALP